MIIQATSHGTAAKEEPFAFTYSGDFTDNRVDGIGTVRLNTSGTLTVTGSPVTVTATIVGAGGGAVSSVSGFVRGGAAGGGGGIQTVEVTLEAGTYDIVIGTGGSKATNTSTAAITGGTGGNTTAFGKTSTGGNGGYAYTAGDKTNGGVGGTPNGGTGNSQINLGSAVTVSGGSPNGGSVVNDVAQAGGDGYVDLTFS